MMSSAKISASNRLNLVLSSAFLLRLLLQTQTSLPDLLSSRLEISTPITSFKRCTSLPSSFTYNNSKRGIVPLRTWCPSLQWRSVSSGQFTQLWRFYILQAPLLLAFLSLTTSLIPSPELAISAIFSLMDLLAARFLTMISSEEHERWRIAAKYESWHD
jgi:hypothetical protein